MQLSFTVHSCHVDDIEVEATLPGGAAVTAIVKGLTIELVSADGRSTLTPRYIPADINADIAAFEVGRAVTVTFEPEQA